MPGAASASIAPFAVHGGRIDLARAAFPGAASWVDLSTGIAPWRYPVGEQAEAFDHLPEPSAPAMLERMAATAFGVAADRVVAVPGSDLALRLIGALVGGSATVVGPGYSGHAAMWHERATVIAPTDIGSIGAGPLVLARPNNPDGLITDPLALEAAARRGVRLIIDEAFVDATPEVSLSGCNWPGLIVVRSFGKYFGLAGLRLGFVIGGADIVPGLRRLLGDWPVSGPAIAIGTAAYADSVWQVAQRARLNSAAHRLDMLLADAGVRVVGGTTFFRLVETDARDALFVHLAQVGILTRPFSTMPHRLRLRFGLPADDAAWDRLEHALTQWRLG